MSTHKLVIASKSWAWTSCNLAKLSCLCNNCPSFGLSKQFILFHCSNVHHCFLTCQLISEGCFFPMMSFLPKARPIISPTEKDLCSAQKVKIGQSHVSTSFLVCWSVCWRNEGQTCLITIKITNVLSTLFKSFSREWSRWCIPSWGGGQKAKQSKMFSFKSNDTLFAQTHGTPEKWFWTHVATVLFRSCAMASSWSQAIEPSLFNPFACHGQITSCCQLIAVKEAGKSASC